MSTRHGVIQMIGSEKLMRKKTSTLGAHADGITRLYASLVFHQGVQRERLPVNIFKSLQDAIQKGKKLDPAIADAVATAMRDWATEHGATHYSHWFQPLTGSTAEKHDCFITPDNGHQVLARFSGSELIRGESDASSFPSGGLRATFEARGYTAWDPSSPAFILENENGATLVIPTMFLSWNGDSLDQKTPMLRSLDALNKQALRVLRVLGNHTAERVECTLGVEQEYFLVDKRLAMLRPDLMITGRTLFGAAPPKGQELDDNYFGAIPQRVLTFMTDLEYELIRLGIPIKTRHNEVAPGQYELAPTFETTNLALDHQMLIMQLLRQIAPRHGFMCLLHEKPFKGVNGSGKHNNWSIGTDKGENLLDPGDTEERNLQFLIFCSALCRAVFHYSKLIRLGVASAGNDLRLGAHEAPPAIMSIHLGYDLEQYYHALFGVDEKNTSRKNKNDLRIPLLQNLPRHVGDRNRTSPIAFTGNKFEFRACGANQNSSTLVTIINTCVAESLDFIATRLEKTLKTGTKKASRSSILDLLEEMAKEFAPIIYNGDNYAAQWKEKAKKRKLPDLVSTADCLELLTSKESVTLFEKYSVYTLAELKSRMEILADAYCANISIEASTALKIAQTQILPAVLKYKKQVLDVLNPESEPQKKLASELDKRLDLLLQAVETLRDRLYDHQQKRTLREKTEYYRDYILPAMHALRTVVDSLEQMVDDDLWPLPTYTELLFVH
ncbi:MAG: glutamine synthetase III [Planctomycetia bacterium]|nr:glutamine synthetase III [Planctomycetia bacterium]